MTGSVDLLLARSRARIRRLSPVQLDAALRAGALVVDIRPAAQRAEEGALDGAVVVERNVLEWRLDPSGPFHLPEATSFGRPVVVVCSEGYASSLAAASLLDLGYRTVADLAGGYVAWRSWRTGVPSRLRSVG